MIDYGAILTTLTDHSVRFILVGGAAGIAHGATRSTRDVGVVYDRAPENLRHLAEALEPIQPYPRGAPPGLPFRLDPETLERGVSFTLTTSHGSLDLLGETTGGGGYMDLLPHTIELELFGTACLCLDLPELVQVERAAGRPKDFDAIAELEIILEERNP